MSAAHYFPSSDQSWERRQPQDVGMDPERLAAAIAYTTSHETPAPIDLHAAISGHNRSEGPSGAIIGPVKPRGGVNGLVLRHGYIVAEWGDTARVDMSFSAAKSYLADLAGLALDRGLIRDIDDPVREYVDDGGFDPPHNSRITWRHLLQQTSEWTGTLWGKPDMVDHNRQTTASSTVLAKSQGAARDLRPPGTLWEYNDVRVNRLALALLRFWGQPLPDLLKSAIMDPIGASATWEWHGYDNSSVTIDGRTMTSVTGGGHWGGGLWINSRDHARFGYLHLRRGRWRDQQLLSEAWIDTETMPSTANPGYGCLWWLNAGQPRYPSAPASSYFAIGWGTNLLWVDPEHDLVAVARWIDAGAVDGFLGHTLAAITS